MDLVTMESFIALCKYNSFTKAAEHLYISQSALSKRIANLESEFGMKLVEHKNNKISLTLPGRDLQEKCQEILLLFHETEKRMRDLKDGINHQLRIGFPSESAFRQIGYAVYAMSQAHPEIEMKFAATPPYINLCDLIHHKFFDCIISNCVDFIRDDEIDYRVFWQNQWCILANRDLPICNAKSCNTAELIKQKIVLYTRDRLYEEHPIVKYLNACGYDQKNFLYTDDRQSMLMYICTGQYIGIGVMGLGDMQDTLNPIIKCIPLTDFNLKTGDRAIGYHKGNLAAKAFVDIIVGMNQKL